MDTASMKEAETKCRLCTCRLDAEEGDDFDMEICRSCENRPEARRLGAPSSLPERDGKSSRHSKPARAFTVAEKALIRKVHGYMPAPQLLGILNERLVCDLGADVARYTMEQLYAEIGDATGAVPAGGHDWASLRKLLAKARRSGVLAQINEQVIDDFAVVFSLNTKQVLSLKEILLRTEEDES